MALESEARQKKIRTRSPAYPYIDLRAALEKAAVLWKAEGRHPAVINVIMQHWGYKEESSTGYSCVAALKKFGLVDHEGMGDSRQIRLSNLALAILLDEDPNSANRQEALKTAALLPRIHAELWERYGSDLPSDQSLKRFLVLERQFNEAAVDELLEEYKQTIIFAGLNRQIGSGPSTAPALSPPQGLQANGQSNASRPFGADPYERRQETPASAFKTPQRLGTGSGGGWTANGASGGFPAPIHAAQHGTGGRLTRPPEPEYEDDEDDWGTPNPPLQQQPLPQLPPSALSQPSHFQSTPRQRPADLPRDERLPDRHHDRPERRESSPQREQPAPQREVRDAAYWEEQRELLHVESRPRPQAPPADLPPTPLPHAATKELPVPLENDLVARVPYPMTEEDFQLLIETLQLWKKRLVRPRE